MDKLYVTVKEQFPQFIQADYPAFIAFVQAYYKWLDGYSIDKIENLVDIDDTAQQFVKYFRQQLDVYGLYSEATPFDIKYVKTIKEIYSSKGSEQSLIFLLKTVYGSDDNTKIVYPRESILRASDGVWDQERFITIKRLFGNVPETVTTIIIEYEGGAERLAVSQFEIIDSETARFYFKTNVSVAAELDQVVKIVVGDNTVYQGTIVPSPQSIRVDNGGKNWQLGQVISFPGTTRDTIARVAEVDNDGTIKRVEVLDHGYNHNINETIIISPYPIKPIGSSFDYDYNYDEDTNTHVLTIFDFTEGTTENINGTSTGLSPESYFLENYASESYAGRVVIQIISTNIASVESPDADSSITIQDWLESRATLRYIFGTVTTGRGKWLNSRGIISDNFIRLQDNYYYQQYSYVVESNVLRSRYQSMLDNIHLAGSKSFSTYSLQQSLDVGVDVSTEIPFKSIYLDDTISLLDVLSNTTIKSVSDSTSQSTDIVNDKPFIKYNVDEVNPLDEITSKQMISIQTDNPISSDVLNIKNERLLALEDNSFANDLLNIEFNTLLEDVSTPVDSLLRTFSKYNVDEVNPLDDISSKQMISIQTDSALLSDALNITNGYALRLEDNSFANDLLNIEFNTLLEDVSTPVDSLLKTPLKVLIDDTDPVTEGFTSTTLTKFVEDTQLSTDTISSKDTIKLFSDESTADQIDTATTDFDLEDYDSENYAEAGLPLSLEATIS